MWEIVNEIKRYANEIRNEFNNLFCTQYFISMKTTGKTEIHYKMKKKTYQFENYLDSNLLPQLKKINSN